MCRCVCAGMCARAGYVCVGVCVQGVRVCAGCMCRCVCVCGCFTYTHNTHEFMCTYMCMCLWMCAHYTECVWIQRMLYTGGYTLDIGLAFLVGFIAPCHKCHIPLLLSPLSPLPLSPSPPSSSPLSSSSPLLLFPPHHNSAPLCVVRIMCVRRGTVPH